MPSFKNSPLLKLNQQQWEDLCDHCGKCCLVKLQDEDTDDVFYTNVHCEFLAKDCTCSVYADRVAKKQGCLVLTKKNLEVLEWLPESCAYKRYHHNLPKLTKNEVVVRFSMVNEKDVPEETLQDHVIDDI